jgi:hypothetical protein
MKTPAICLKIMYKSNCVSSSGIIASLVSNSSIATMAFKKSLAALVFALPLVLGMNLFFSKNVDVLNYDCSFAKSSTIQPGM